MTAAPLLAPDRAPTVDAPPASGVAVGGYVDLDGSWNGDAQAIADVASRESDLGRGLAVDHHFYAWTDRFPGALESDDRANGRVPLVTWEPVGVTLAQVASGGQDSVIRARADAVRNTGKVYLRWGHEMNGNWYGWDGAHNNTPGTTDGPAKYVAAYRHVHDVFAARGATNVSWVWSPNATDLPTASWNHWTNYYPGDNYVDMVGIDAYNFGTMQPGTRWTELSTLVRPMYDDYAARKPVMLAEVGSTEKGGSKAAWIDNVAATLPGQFPGVRVLVFFDAPVDWKLKSSTTAWAAYRRLANDPAFAGAVAL